MTSFGGPAMIPYIGRMAIEEKGWIDEETYRAGIALCQFIPGASAMQMAAYVGLRARGVAGAGASYIAFGLPAFLMIVVLSALYAETEKLPVTASLFSGLEAITVAIVAFAAFSFARGYLTRQRDLAVALVAAALFILGMSPFLVILLAAFSGLLIYRDLLARERSTLPGGAPKNIRPLIFISPIAGLGFLILFIFSRELFDLAITMFWVDLFSFGGGFASLPLMLNEVVVVRSWMDYQTFMSGIALGQVTPGPIVITATFVGYMVEGMAGSIAATVGIFLPSFLILIAIVPYYDRLSGSPEFNRAVQAIMCTFVGLLTSVAINFAYNMTADPLHIAMVVVAFVLLFKVDIVWVILVGAAVSALLL